MKIGILAVAVLLQASAVYAQTPAPLSADDSFVAISTREWQWRRQIEGGDETIPAHLPDVSVQAQAGRLAYWLGVRKDLDAVDRAGLTFAVEADDGGAERQAGGR